MSQILVQKESQEIINVHALDFSEKLRLMAETLRNCGDLEQCKTRLYDGKNKFCVMGALGFKGGVPKDDLFNSKYIAIYNAYGLTPHELDVPFHLHHFQ
jgi:hypothetical protein